MASFVRLSSSVLLIVMCLVLPSVRANLIMMGPVDSTAAENTDVVFYCQIRPGSPNLVYWVVDRSTGLGPNENNNPAYPRYEIFGDKTRGYYNLRIMNVTAADAVTYDCVVDNQGNGANYEAGAELTVVNDPVAPIGPQCVNAPTNELTFTEGDELDNYRCRALDGIPVGELQWNSLRSDQSLVDVSFDVQVDGSGITAVSSGYTLTAADHGSRLACSLSHPSLNADTNCYIPATGQINVRHFPQIEFGPAISVHYLESTTVSVRCFATAYPAVSLGPTLIFSDPEKMLNITRPESGVIEATFEIAQRDVGKYINCSAVNVLGETISTIDITLAPLLPGWLLITVLIAGIVLLLFFVLCCCFCCCNGCKSEKQDQPDLGDTKAAGYDVNESRAASMYKPNGLSGEDPPQPIDDGSGFTDIPLNDYTTYPPPPPEPASLSNDHETGEINEGYLTPMADEMFPPMIEDEHLMGEKRVSTFKPDNINDVAPPPPPPPPPPLDLDNPTPIPSVEDD